MTKNNPIDASQTECISSESLSLGQCVNTPQTPEQT